MSRRADPQKPPQTHSQAQAQAKVQDRERERARAPARQPQHTVAKDNRQRLLPAATLVQPPMPYATTAGYDAAFSTLPGEALHLATGSVATATRVLKTFPAGAPGAVKLTRRYGRALICVRYRTDASGHFRYTTVELVIEQVPVQHRTAPPMVAVKLAYDEPHLRSQAVKLGAKWNAKTRLWHMPKTAAKALGLTARIMKK